MHPLCQLSSNPQPSGFRFPLPTSPFHLGSPQIEGRQALSQVEVVLGICPGWKEAKLIKCLALSAAGRGDEAYGLTTSLMRGGMMNNSGEKGQLVRAKQIAIRDGFVLLFVVS